MLKLNNYRKFAILALNIDKTEVTVLAYEAKHLYRIFGSRNYFIQCVTGHWASLKKHHIWESHIRDANVKESKDPGI